MTPQQARRLTMTQPGLADASEPRTVAGASRSLWSRVPVYIQGSRILLWGVAVVVVLVSLPLLKSVALKENEMDALRALNLLGNEVFAADGQQQSASTLNFRELLKPNSELGRRLPDTRLVADGRVMFHHGYLFEIVPQGDGNPQLRAWPMAHGTSGLGAFCCDGTGAVLGHPNQQARWSGLDTARAWPAASTSSESLAGWRALDASPQNTGAGI